MTLTFNPNPKQFKAWEYLNDNKTTEIGYGGAASGGKSYLGCFWLIAMCEAYPDTGWLIGRKELVNLKRTTLLTFFKVCSDFDLKPDVYYKFNQQTNIIDWHNGSQLFLFDLGYKPSDPLYTRLGGLELTGGFVDESNEVQAKAITTLSTRLGRRKNKEYKLLPKLLEGFNPDKGHVYIRYYKPFRANQLPKHRKFIQALPTDNPYTTKEYLDQLRNADKVTRERLLLGNFEYDDDPTALIDYEAIIDLYTNSIDEGERFITADIARYGSDKTVITIWYGLIIHKVYTYEQQGIDVTAEKIKELSQQYTVPYSRILVDEDGIGGGVVDILTGIKGFIANSQPTINPKTQKPFNYQNFKAQCAYLLSEYINNHQMAIRHNNEDYKLSLIEELEQIKTKDVDKDGKLKIIGKDEVKEIIGRSPDYADCLLMRMYFELKKPITNFTPQNVGGIKQYYPSLGI